MGIVVFGAVFVDIKGYPDNKFIPGGRNVGRVIQTHGGVSRNVAEDIANVGLRPTFVSVVDDNGTGEDVVSHLRRHRVNTDYILRYPDGMGTWLATFDHCGDVVASISKRPDLSPLMQIVEEHGDELISGADSVVVEFDLETDLLCRIFSLAEKYHKDVYAVVSNMAIAMERRSLLRKTACIVCNKQEAAMLFSEDYTDVPADKLQERRHAAKAQRTGMQAQRSPEKGNEIAGGEAEVKKEIADDAEPCASLHPVAQRILLVLQTVEHLWLGLHRLYQHTVLHRLSQQALNLTVGLTHLTGVVAHVRNIETAEQGK